MTTRKQVLKLDIKQVKNLIKYYKSIGKDKKVNELEIELEELKRKVGGMK